MVQKSIYTEINYFNVILNGVNSLTYGKKRHDQLVRMAAHFEIDTYKPHTSYAELKIRYGGHINALNYTLAFE